jgi:outer membrane protein
VREEAASGSAPLDVLNAQQALVNALALVTAQRDRVVASYAVLAACGAFAANPRAENHGL